MTEAVLKERPEAALARREVTQRAASSAKPVMAFTQEQAAQTVALADGYSRDSSAFTQALIEQQSAMIENLRDLGFNEAANDAQRVLALGSDRPNTEGR